MTEYQMPENMGFPIRQTVSEMLPDELLVSPESQVGRYGKTIHASMHEYVCAACGKRFEAYSEHRYKIRSQAKGRERLEMYCSYTCFRPAERAAQEKFKSDTLCFTPGYGREKSPLLRAQDRVSHCEKRLAEYQAIRSDAKAWSALSKTRKNTITKLIAAWTEKLEYARKMLEEVKNEE